jgi:NAD(P)-dependent dehydrogenase (short-subunit alcohol dehydrogenase family)
MTETSYKELFSLKGKTAIVTGGCGILGTRFCWGLAEFGANVAIVDIAGTSMYELALELSGTHGVKALGIECDIASLDSVRAMVQTVVEALGDIHILHNNAQGHPADPAAALAPFEEYSLEEWRSSMSVNVDGYFLVAQAVGNQMLAQKTAGSIIQTASIYGLMAPDQRVYEGSFCEGLPMGTPAVYTVAKAAIIGLTKYLATYWAERGIRVNTLTPGGVETGQNDVFKKKYSARIPFGRMAHRDEMVGALIYLASDASGYVTGQNIVVDGGLNAW